MDSAADWLLLAAIAIAAFILIRPGISSWPDVYTCVYQPKNVGLCIQVFCEDVAIAIVFVRLRAAIGLRGSIVLVACLFAAAHLPSMVAEGASFRDLSRLVLDAGLGVAVLFVAQRSSDIWWFWSVHFAMDMMQFCAVAAKPA